METTSTTKVKPPRLYYQKGPDGKYDFTLPPLLHPPSRLPPHPVPPISSTISPRPTTTLRSSTSRRPSSPNRPSPTRQRPTPPIPRKTNRGTLTTAEELWLVDEVEQELALGTLTSAKTQTGSHDHPSSPPKPTETPTTPPSAEIDLDAISFTDLQSLASSSSSPLLDLPMESYGDEDFTIYESDDPSSAESSFWELETEVGRVPPSPGGGGGSVKGWEEGGRRGMSTSSSSAKLREDEVDHEDLEPPEYLFDPALFSSSSSSLDLDTNPYSSLDPETNPYESLDPELDLAALAVGEDQAAVEAAGEHLAEEYGEMGGAEVDFEILDELFPTTTPSTSRKSRILVPELSALPLAAVPPTESQPGDPVYGYGYTKDGRVGSRFEGCFGEKKGERKGRGVVRFRKAARASVGKAEEPFTRAVEEYTDRFTSLLESEQQESELAAHTRMTLPIDSLVRAGYALEGVGGRLNERKVWGKMCAVFANVGKKGTQGFGWNRFTPGTAVLLSRTDPTIDPVRLSQKAVGEKVQDYNVGSVHMQLPGQVYVTFDQPVEDIGEGVWRLDVWTSDIALKRTLAALKALNDDPIAQDRAHEVLLTSERDLHHAKFLRELKDTPVEELTESQQTFVLPPQAEVALSGTALRDVLLGGLDAEEVEVGKGVFHGDERIMGWADRHLAAVEGEVVEVKKGDPVLFLNWSQKRAIALMLKERVSLIQGPPGTGKTRTIVEAIHMIKCHWKVRAPILVSAYTNAAVDNLADGLHKRGVRTLRFGNKTRVREDLHELTLESKLNNHREKDSLDKTKLRLRDCQGDKLEKDALRKIVYGKEQKMIEDILGNTDAICATCISSVSRTLQTLDFPIVFLDEASMATEPASLIPLTKGSAHVAIIGDHKQLPPVIISEEGKDGGLAISLFERLIREQQTPSIMLDTQYRMHPSISSFPNTTFYGGLLSDGTVSPSGVVSPKLIAPQTAYLPVQKDGKLGNLSFIDHKGRERSMSKSLVNEGDADIVCDVVADLLFQNPDLIGADIGIIAPYTAQISHISYKLHQDPSRKSAFSALLGEERAQQTQNIEIKTVDGFEGREKEVIIFSTVRSNAEGGIGFLVDWRRMNVGLTRAKRALIMVGSARTLGKAKSITLDGVTPNTGAVLWRDFIRHLREQNAVITPV